MKRRSAQQQDYETPLVKGFIHSLPDVLSEDKAALDNMAAAGMKKDQTLQTAAAASAKPVKHTINIEVVK